MPHLLPLHFRGIRSDDMPHIVVAAVSLMPSVRVAWNTMVVTRILALLGRAVWRVIFGSLMSPTVSTRSSIPNHFQARLLVARS